MKLISFRPKNGKSLDSHNPADGQYSCYFVSGFRFTSPGVIDILPRWGSKICFLLSLIASIFFSYSAFCCMPKYCGTISQLR